MSTVNQPNNLPPAAETEVPKDWKHRLLNPIGYILGISYPLLALSAGARGIYQYCCREDITKLGPALSIFSSLLYIVAAIGFFSRKPAAWRVSVVALTIETIGVLVVGTLSLLRPDVVNNTVWGEFGAEYAFFPVFQPILGLIWLLWKPTREAYGISKPAP